MLKSFRYYGSNKAQMLFKNKDPITIPSHDEFFKTKLILVLAGMFKVNTHSNAS